MKPTMPSYQSYLFAFTFIILMVAFAVFLNDPEIILPEIAAMAVALWTYQMPDWLKQPEKIFIIPTLTAFIGFGINFLTIPYLAKIFLMLIALILLIRLMKYAFPPALATGFLPIVTNAHDWSFIISIMITTAILALGVILFRLNKGIKRDSYFEASKLYAYLGITGIWIIITAIFSIDYFALIPPITVVLYESLKMPHYTFKMALKQTLILTFSISIAVGLYFIISHWILLTVIYLIIIYALLRVFNMRIPAAYAFPLLVFVFPESSIPYLPVGSFMVAAYSFAMVLLFNRYQAKKALLSSL